MKSPARLAWIDALKGMGIILVAAAHHPGIWAYSEALGRAIFSFNMPLFFFVTGLTLNQGMSVRALAARALSCLIPYFVLALASLPMIFHLHPEVSLIDLLLGIVYGTGHTIFTVPLWFLPCLAVTLGFIYVIDRLATAIVGPTAAASAAAQLLLFVMLQAGWQFAISFDYQLVQHAGWGQWLRSGAPWSMEVALAGASYVLLGRLFTGHFGSTAWVATPQWIACALVAAVFVAMNLLLQPMIDLNWRYDRPFAVSPLVALAGILATVLLAVSIRNRIAMWVLRWLGTSTILILWAHATIEKSVFKLLAPSVGGLAIVASMALALFLPALAALVVKRIPVLHTLITPNAFLKKRLAERPRDTSSAPSARGLT